MERASFLNAEGIVLRAISYREADVIATLYTREAGRIGVIAYGARKMRSRLGPHVQLFRFGTYVLRRSGALWRLSQAETLRPFASLHGDVMRTAQAAVLAEWMLETQEEETPDPLLFDLLYWALARLDDGDDAEVVVRAFELRLLARLGYGPEWRRCVRCGAESERSHFSAVEGGAICRRCAPAVPDAEEVPRALMMFVPRLLTVPPNRLGRVMLHPPQREALRRVLDRFVARHVPVRLNARRMFEAHDALALASRSLAEARRARGAEKEEDAESRER